ncbi:MAG: hypothetical protein ACYS74_13495 [Planctomycetota bacterium]|jgi:hypothetical protein
MPIQNFRKMPTTMVHSTAVPRIAPVRVAMITSPEPIYSAAQTKDGPTIARAARPTGAFLIARSLLVCELSFIASTLT